MTRNIFFSALLAPGLAALCWLLAALFWSPVGEPPGPVFDPADQLGSLQEMLAASYQFWLFPALLVGAISGIMEVSGRARRTRLIAAPLGAIVIALVLGHGFPQPDSDLMNGFSTGLFLGAVALGSIVAAAVSMAVGRWTLERTLNRMQGITT